MTQKDAELAFHRELDKAILNAHENGLSKELISGALLLSAAHRLKGRVFALYNEMLHDGFKPQ
jgi:hypothetical protein